MYNYDLFLLSSSFLRYVAKQSNCFCLFIIPSIWCSGSSSSSLLPIPGGRSYLVGSTERSHSLYLLYRCCRCRADQSNVGDSSVLCSNGLWSCVTEWTVVRPAGASTQATWAPRSEGRICQRLWRCLCCKLNLFFYFSSLSLSYHLSLSLPLPP